jgi:steroid 5-alpha reductase family enzyme
MRAVPDGLIGALAANVAALALVMLACWLVSLASGKVSFVDSVWGAAMAGLAVLSLMQVAEPGPLAMLIMAMTVIWGVRLALHLWLRFARNGEDPRYVRILAEDRAQGRFALASGMKVWLLQGVLLFAVAMPAQAGILLAGADGVPGALAFAGLALWAIGIVFEWVGDWQLARFKGDPANAGRVMDRGLWRYTRHPNYFGDACVWWGIWLAAADASLLAALLGLPGLAFLTFTLTRWSGAAMTEEAMAARYGPAFADYVRRTPAFLPGRPRAD